jgi:hypothetical protein
MKHKLLVLFLALTVMSWAQSTTPNQTPAPEQKTVPADAKPACPCCDKMADHAAMHKDMDCCKHHDASAKDGKESMSCCSEKDAKGEMACGGKDAKACMKKDGAKGDKSSASCCANGKGGEGHEMACCSAKEGSASGCCGGNQCGKHNHEPASPGN